MSDYRVYIKNGNDDVEINIPDIYRDPDSETNSDQIKTFISTSIITEYDDLSIDIKRNGKFKRKCNDFEIEDGDEVYVYSDKKQKTFDISKIKLVTGFHNIIDSNYHNYNFNEVQLNSILSKEEKHRIKIDSIMNDIIPFLSKIKDYDDKNFILNLRIMSFNTNDINNLPFNELDNGWYFGFLKNKLPVGFGYFYDNTKKIYYEGNFSECNLHHGKSLSLCSLNGINELNSYYCTCDLFVNFLMCNRGFKKYLFRNEIYTGSFSENLYANCGVLITDDGEYKGIFKDGLAYSYGFKKYINGDVYNGYWYEGKRNMFGKITFKNNDFYSGIWHNDIKEEFGIFYDAKRNLSYTGTFKNDLRTFNKNEFKLTRGLTFCSNHVGDCLKIPHKINGKLNQLAKRNIFIDGFLTETISNNHEIVDSKESCNFYYIGHYDTFQRYYGMGRLFFKVSDFNDKNSYPDHDFYSVEHTKNKYKGFVKYYSNFINGLPNGFGMIDYGNDDIYIGNIRNGQSNGQGTLFKHDGTTIKAFWNSGSYSKHEC